MQLSSAFLDFKQRLFTSEFFYAVSININSPVKWPKTENNYAGYLYWPNLTYGTGRRASQQINSYWSL